jgi:hypothetical protein
MNSPVNKHDNIVTVHTVTYKTWDGIEHPSLNEALEYLNIQDLMMEMHDKLIVSFSDQAGYAVAKFILDNFTRKQP